MYRKVISDMRVDVEPLYASKTCEVSEWQLKNSLTIWHHTRDISDIFLFQWLLFIIQINSILLIHASIRARKKCQRMWKQIKRWWRNIYVLTYLNHRLHERIKDERLFVLNRFKMQMKFRIETDAPFQMYPFKFLSLWFCLILDARTSYERDANLWIN